jgi:hypothetical protein
MISPPLSPDFTFDSDALTPSILPALEYISKKLQQKSMHVTLLVGRGKPVPTGDAADLIVIPITELDFPSWKTFYKVVEKGSKKFSLGQSWTHSLNQHLRQRLSHEYLVQQSIRQNEILFSQEGLTLLNVDRIYTFKRRLCVLSTIPKDSSKKDPDPVEEKYIASCVHLLHKTIHNFQGRPFSLAFFHRVYDHMDVSDDMLVKVAVAYKARYGHDGIVIPSTAPPKVPPPKVPPFKAALRAAAPNEHARKSPVLRGNRLRRSGMSSRYGVPSRAPSRMGTPPRRGPRTPLSASDVTPITRTEWNILIGPEFSQNKPTVTMWVPSPAVPAFG